MAYTREHLLATWGTGEDAMAVAFPVQAEGFRAPTRFPKQANRNLDGDLLVARGAKKKEFIGRLILDESQDGETVEYDSVTYDIGQAEDLEEMYEATDLQIKRHGDSAFFDAAVMGDYDPDLFTHTGSVLLALVQIVER